MRLESALLVAGVATTAAGILWLVYYITAVFPAVIGGCPPCTGGSAYAQPPFDWGIFVLVIGITLVWAGLLIRRSVRPKSRARKPS